MAVKIKLSCLEGGVLLVAAVYILSQVWCHLGQDLAACLTACLSCQFIVLMLKMTTDDTFHEPRLYYRSCSDSGYLSSLLVPLAVTADMVCVTKHKLPVDTDLVNASVAYVCIMSSLSTLALVSNHSSQRRGFQPSIYMTLVLLCLSMFVASFISARLGVTKLVLLLVLSVILFQAMLRLPRVMTRSFTPAEISCVIQLCGVGVWRALYAVATPRGITSKLYNTDLVATIVYFTLAVIVLVYVLLPSNAHYRQWSFYAVFAAASALVVLPTTYIVLKQNVVSWLLYNMFGFQRRIQLLSLWVLCSVMTAILVSWYNSRRPLSQEVNTPGHPQPTGQTSAKLLTSANQQHENRDMSSSKKQKHKDTSSKPPHKSSRSAKEHARSSDVTAHHQKRSGNTVLRKCFHLMVLVVYVPGLLMDADFLHLASVFAGAFLLVLEILRIFSIPPLGPAIDRAFQMFVDEKDEGRVILSHIYLLVGLSLPLWMTSLRPVAGNLIPMYSGVVALGIGDTAASIGGSLCGHYRWPGTKKTVEGTAICAVSQLLAMVLLVQMGAVSAQLSCTLVVAAILSSLYEAFTLQIDNLVLPLLTFALLSVS